MMTIGRLRKLIEQLPETENEREVMIGYRDGMGWVQEPCTFAAGPAYELSKGHYVLSTVPYPSLPAKKCKSCKREIVGA